MTKNTIETSKEPIHKIFAKAEMLDEMVELLGKSCCVISMRLGHKPGINTFITEIQETLFKAKELK